MIAGKVDDQNMPTASWRFLALTDHGDSLRLGGRNGNTAPQGPCFPAGLAVSVGVFPRRQQAASASVSVGRLSAQTPSALTGSPAPFSVQGQQSLS